MDLSASQRALRINEVLSQIFSYCFDDSGSRGGKKTLARCACVCKNWSPPALDLLWEEIEDVCSIFKLLGQYTEDQLFSRRRYHFALSEVDHSALPRFKFYSRRIKSLHYDQVDFARIDLKYEVREFLSRNLDLWPKLREFRVSVDNIDDIPWSMFPGSIVRFQISLSSQLDGELDFAELLAEISINLPNLLHVDLRGCSMLIEPFHHDIVRFIHRYPALQYVGLPYHCINPTVAVALAALPSLHTVRQGENRSAGDDNDHLADEWGVEIEDNDDREVGEKFSPALPENCFPKLQRFAFNGTIVDGHRFISRKSIAANLTELSIGSCEYGSTGRIVKFLDQLSLTCPNLTSLRLDLYDPIVETTSQLDEEQGPWFGKLYPSLCSLKNLQSLDLRHPCSFEMYNEQIEKLAQSLQQLTYLNLNSLPTHNSVSWLGSSSLVSFATHCPNMRHLSLLVDAESVFDQPLPDPVMFRSLEKLSVGLSKLDNPERFARFLSEVLPVGCELEYGYPGKDRVKQAWIQELYEGKWEFVKRAIYSLAW